LPPQEQVAGGGGAPGGPVVIMNEDRFVRAYTTRRSPRMMIFVNRTILGDPLSAEGFERLVRQGDQIAPGGIVGAADYQMIEAALVQYFDNSGRVRVQDSDAARSKLTREQVLRIENGDPAANRLLASELQAEVLVQVTARPTTQASVGGAIRLVAKAVGTTDARNLGTAFVDMQLPMSKTNINLYTRYLAEELMGQMATKWSLPAEYNPIEVRIYKAAGVDDTLKISQWIKSTRGVTSVNVNSATGGSATAYASFSVAYSGSPMDFYADLKASIGLSQGLKAVDMQNNTINLEVTGPMNLITTTRHVESTTTTETHVTEERRIEPISPAPAQRP
jgi:hypothetical protein